MKNKKYISFFSITFLLIIYKNSLDFILLPTYYKVFSYLSGSNYKYDFNKFLISYVAFVVIIILIFKLFSKKEELFLVFLITCCISIIPMLSIYAFIDYVTISSIIFPLLFWSILVISFYFFEKSNREISFPAIKNISKVLLIFSTLGTFFCWIWSGCPLLLDLSHSTTQRIELRINPMPQLMGYLFVILGGVIIPYLFAKFFNRKRYLYACFYFMMGFLLFSINGMKTWLFLYIFVIGIYKIIDFYKNDFKKIGYSIVILFILLTIFISYTYTKFGIVDFLSQIGRVTCIPNGIGFRSINFFKDNELLYLRESILRYFFETPYIGGSDFYIDNGINRTINSARSNNGLWGDAFRNFGMIGVILYPILISYFLKIIYTSLRYNDLKFKTFVMFLVIWNSINVSFFTWILTGGVIIIFILNNSFKKEDLKFNLYKRRRYENKFYFHTR